MPDLPIQEYIRQAASKAGVPPELALAVAQQESGFNPTAVNPKSGATGVFQFIPSTAKARGLNATDPVQNIQHGVTYLRELLDRHQGNVDAVLKEYGGVVNDTSYVPSVVARMKNFTGGPATTTPPPAPTAMPAFASAGMPGIETPRAKLSPGEAISKSTTGMLGMVGMDPTERSGRRNIAGAAGAAMALPVAMTVGIPAGFGLATAGVLGAMTAGGGQELVESAVDKFRGAPPPPGGLVERVGQAATEQGMYETGGQVIAWPFKAAGRRLVAGKVGEQARTALSAAREHLMGQLDSGMKAAQATADSLKQRLGMQVPAVARDKAGTMAIEAIQGPAQSARDAVGRSVKEAAVSGPAIPAQPLRDRLTELSDQITPQIGSASSIDADRALLDQYKSGSALGKMPPAERTAYQEALKRVQAAPPTLLAPDHPLPRVLDHIRSVIGEADTVPFEELYKVQRLLDDTVNWDKSSKKQVEQITKGFRKTVRQMLGVHEPFNIASDNYRAVSRLHDQGVAPRLLRVAESNPESITKLIKSDEPTKLKMMKELLLDESRAGGDAAKGIAAWNSVRAAWTHENLVRGGVEHLGDRIAKMDPDFQHAMYGDTDGRIILTNLEMMSSTWQHAGQRLKDIAKYVTEAKKPTVLEKGLVKSSLNKAPTIEEEGADAIMAAFGPFGVWKARALMRTLKGPKLNDLIFWASYSPKRTQLFVDAVTNPAPGMMVADLIRLFDAAGLVDDLNPSKSNEEPKASPPPVPARAAGAGPLATSGPPPPPRSRQKTVEDSAGNLIPLQ